MPITTYPGLVKGDKSFTCADLPTIAFDNLVDRDPQELAKLLAAGEKECFFYLVCLSPSASPLDLIICASHPGCVNLIRSRSVGSHHIRWLFLPRVPFLCFRNLAYPPARGPHVVALLLATLQDLRLLLTSPTWSSRMAPRRRSLAAPWPQAAPTWVSRSFRCNFLFILLINYG